MSNFGINFSKIFAYNRTAILPVLVVCAFIIYYFSISEFPDNTYHTIHMAFLITSLLAFLFAVILRTPVVVISTSILYISYVIINTMRYSYGEDYVFSAGYNVWSILILPNLLLAYHVFTKNNLYKYWSWSYLFILIETSIIERLQSQKLDADSYVFYKHIGMLNYPAFYMSLGCLMILFINQIRKGKILNIATLCASLAVFLGLYHSDNLFAFSLFFLTAALVEFCSIIYYSYYIQYKDEDLDTPNLLAFYKEADNQRKYPLKYSISLMYIDEYERLVKRFGKNKALILKKMFIVRIHKVKPNALIYNYKPDAFIITFKNYNTAECFEAVEDIRRIIAKSIFIFNENNHLQLTVSQCVSEKKRSDSNAAAVLVRAEEKLKKACKFTHNITIKA